MKAFSDNELRKYEKEAKEKWGNTVSFRQYEEKTGNFSKDKRSAIAEETDGIMAEFSECLKIGESFSSDTAHNLVKKLRDHITENYYNCTDEVLSGLGQMYVADERFKHNIDRHGEGTAEFISNAITVYLKGDRGA